MIFDEWMNNYKNGIFDKKQYAGHMFSKYEELLDYRNLLVASSVSKITIDRQNLVFTLENKNRFDEKYYIDMKIYKDDAAAVPITALSFKEGYEEEELCMVCRVLSYIEKGIVFDIGANLGWYSLNICKQYPDLKCFAFEPIEETYQKLIDNIKRNSLKNCEAFNLGLSNENRKISFYYDVLASGASSMVDLRGINTTKLVNCEVITLDDFMNKSNDLKLDFIKCDVEGSELLVYQGGIQTIQKYKPIVFSEMLRKWSAKFGYHPNDIIEFFKENGYLCYVIDSVNQKLKICELVNEETVETNYFFLHKEKHKNIINDMS